jgi:hypothetical protein
VGWAAGRIRRWATATNPNLNRVVLAGSSAANTGGSTTLAEATGALNINDTIILCIHWTGTGTVSTVASSLGHDIAIDTQSNQNGCGAAIASFTCRAASENPTITVTFSASVTNRRFFVYELVQSAGQPAAFVSSPVTTASATSLVVTATNSGSGGPICQVAAVTLSVNKASVAFTTFTERHDAAMGTSHNGGATRALGTSTASSTTCSWTTACAAVGVCCEYGAKPTSEVGDRGGQSEALTQSWLS